MNYSTEKLSGIEHRSAKRLPPSAARMSPNIQGSIAREHRSLRKPTVPWLRKDCGASQFQASPHWPVFAGPPVIPQRRAPTSWTPKTCAHAQPIQLVHVDIHMSKSVKTLVELRIHTVVLLPHLTTISQKPQGSVL